MNQESPRFIYGECQEIKNHYPAQANKEISVEVGRTGYLIIYGTHVNGGFCCIPNWGFGCEMGQPEDVGYNKEQLGMMFADSVAEALACAIRDAFAEG